MARYIDEETGLEIDPANLGDYEPASSKSGSAGDWYTDLALEPFIPISNAFAGGAQALGDVLGDWDPGLAQWGQEQRQLGENVKSRLREPLGLEPGGVGSTLLDAYASAGGPMALMPLGAAKTLAGLGTLAAGERYGTYRDEGADPLTAAAGAAASGLTSIGTAAIPVGWAMRPTGSLLSNVLGGAATQAGINYFLGVPGQSVIDAGVSGFRPSAEELADMQRQSLAPSILTGGLFGLGGRLARPGRAKIDPDIPPMPDDIPPASPADLPVDMQPVELVGIPQLDNALPPALVDAGETLPARVRMEGYYEPALPAPEELLMLPAPDRKGLPAPDRIIGPDEQFSAIRPDQLDLETPAIIEPTMHEESPYLRASDAEVIDAMQADKEFQQMMAPDYAPIEIQQPDLYIRPNDIPQIAEAMKAPPVKVVEQPKETFAKPVEVVSDVDIPVPKPQPEPVAKPEEPMVPQIKAEAIPKEAPVESPPAQGSEQAAVLQADQFPIVRAKVSEAGVNPELMQFKEADAPDGTNAKDRISGDWNELRGGVQLWYEPLPQNYAKYKVKEGQKYLVANGHHRHQAAKAKGVKEVNVQIVREADGVTPEMARALAAEQNIVEGKGTVYDQAKFLRNQAATYGKDAAMVRARSLGIRGRKAASIANLAEDNLWSLFYAGKIEPDQAQTIAEFAPRDIDAQAAGAKAALHGAEGPAIQDAISAFRMTRDKAEQGSMFGVDAEVWEDASRQIISEHRAALADEASGIRAGVKSAEATRAGQTDMFETIAKDEAAAMQRLSDIKTENQRLKSVDQHIAKELDPEIRARYDILKKQKDSMPAQESLFQRLAKNQKGAVRLRRPPGQDTHGWMQDLTKPIEQFFNRETGEIDALAKELGASFEHKGLAPSEKFLGRGWLGDYGLPEAGGVDVHKNLVAAYRKAFIFPKTLAEKAPKMAPIFEEALRHGANRDRIASNIYGALAPYYRLPKASQARVNQALAWARREGPKVKLNEATLEAVGLTPEETHGALAVRQGMDLALDQVAKAYAANPGADPAKISATIEGMRAENYVPFGRFGDRFIYAEKAGAEPWFSLHENVKSLKKTALELGRRGYQIKEGRFNRPPKEAYDDLPLSVTAKLSDLGGGDLPPLGFREHLIKARLSPGYEADLGRNIAEYVQQLSNWAAKKQTRPKFAELLGQIDPKAEPSLYGYAKRYQDYILSNDPEAQAVRGLLAQYYLGFNAKSAAVNLTQSITTTLPALSTITPKPVPAYLAAMKEAVHYFWNPATFAKRHPALSSALKAGISDGVISEQIYRDLAGKAKGKEPGKSLSDYSMAMFSGAEKLNRVHAFIAAWEAKADMAPADRIKFAEKFVQDTQFIYGKENRPEIMRGKKASLFVFRTFAGNMLRFMRNNMEPGRFKALAGTLAAQLALAGGLAIPGVKELEKLLETYGGNPRKALRESLGDSAGLAMYGLPDSAGITLTGPLSIGELPTDVAGGLEEAVVRAVGGVAVDPYYRAKKALYLGGEMKDPYRAVEQILPEALRNVAVAFRGATRPGGMRTPKGEPLVEAPTAGETFAKALGFTYSRLNRAYEDSQTRKVAKDLIANNGENWNWQIAKAYFEKDQDALSNIYSEIRQWNQNHGAEQQFAPDSASIQQHILTMKDPGAATLKATPKRGRQYMGEVLATQRR